jgi:chitinase
MQDRTNWDPDYMKGFDLRGLEPYVDWLNVMTYDLHGSWDKPLLALPHTNLSGKLESLYSDPFGDKLADWLPEITQSLQLVWNANIDPKKVNMGLAYYGKSFTLSDPSCNKPGCAASGPGKAGPCSAEAGTLIDAEIEAILKNNTSIKPILDENAVVKYFSWDTNQWCVLNTRPNLLIREVMKTDESNPSRVSYDDEETFATKINFAKSNCLGGVLAWAIDMSSSTSTQSRDLMAMVRTGN